MLNNATIKVLYVDDEENNLISFKATFRRMFDVYTAKSASEGLKILQEHPIHVILVDQRMPHVSGFEFFKVIKSTYPRPTRMLITGFSDIEAVISAINEGEIFRYIKKPWDAEEIQTAIRNAYEVYSTKLQLEYKMAELEKANDELNRFVYSISHDLRTPLSSALGVLHLAKIDNSITDPNNYIGMLEDCIDRMDTYTKKVIEYYKIARLNPEYTEVNLETLIESNINLLKLQNRNIEYQISVDTVHPFYTDEFRLSVIIDNLLSNAVKYQNPEEHHPHVHIHARVTDEEAIIGIEDNGIGIIKEHLDNVFNIFFRTNNHLKREGLGIGLFIVKEALTKMGGNIAVQSVVNKGTSFHIILPNQRKKVLTHQ